NTGGDQSKHGIWFSQIDECKKIAAKYDLKITGLHTHIGSGTDFEHQQQVCEYMGKFAEQFGPDLEMLSTGGGLPIPYKEGETYIDLDRYFGMWNEVRNRLEQKFGHKVRLETEPGRYIVAESGYLITEIRAVKTQGENMFYIVDAGFNNLARPIMYGAYHPISIAKKNSADSAQNIDSAKNTDYQACDVTVGGPLCESGDIFTQEEGGFVVKRTLPCAEVGDYLIIEIAGAYGSVMGSNYNSKPLAAEVLIDNGSAKLIRQRQTFEHLIQNEMC
ncbi:MAG: diaminopimelate decarboxylase family protein, partial [Thermoguttaceae bacterium]